VLRTTILCFTAVNLAVSDVQRNMSWAVEREKTEKDFGSMCGVDTNAYLRSAKYMRTALFWVVTQWVGVISYRRFGTSYRSRLQGFLNDVWGCLISPSSRISCRRFWASYRSHLEGFLTDVSGHPNGPSSSVFFPTFRGILSVPY